MQFNVPQFIEIEDKILGPLTLKQFLILLAGGVVLIFLWYSFKLWFVLFIGIPLFAAIAAALFIKIGGRPASVVFMAWIKYQLAPRIFVWRRPTSKNQ